MDTLKSFFDPASYAQMERGTKRTALKQAMSRMFLSPQKEGDAEDASNGAVRRHSSAYNIPVLVDSGSGMSVYEIEAGENGVSEVGDHTPLKYSLSVPSGFKHLSDPKTKRATGTFIYGEGNATFLTRRSELAGVDMAIAALRLKTGPIDKEMSSLESRRAKLITEFEAMPKLQDRFEFCIGIKHPTSVELLPLQDEELQELSRLVEAEAQEKLLKGRRYDVIETKQHHRASTSEKPKAGSQARGGRGEEEDQAEWQGWEMVCCNPGEAEEGGGGGREGKRYVGVVLLRRKYIPDEGLYYQDITLTVTWIQPLASRRNPLSFDTIEVLRHLEMLKMDEGKNRPGELSADADEIATLLSSVVVRVDEPRGGIGKGSQGKEEFEDSFDSPAQDAAEAWAKLQAIALEDANNPLLMDQIVGGFYGDEEEASEEEQLRRTARLRTAWAERVGRYVAFCIDGVTMGPVEGVTKEATQRAIASDASRLNDIVLAKLLKLKYLRRLCQAGGAQASSQALAPYAALLIALLQRPHNAVNLTLQVAKELADLACAPETLGLLKDHDTIQAISTHLQKPSSLNEMVLYYAAIALSKLADKYPPVQLQLKRSTLPLELRAHIARVSLRVHAACQQLLEQTRA